MHKKKEIIQDVTLHDLDVANARPQVSDSTDEVFTEKLFDIDVMVTRIIKEIIQILKGSTIGKAVGVTP